MKLRFTPRAVQDIAELAAYNRDRNPPASRRVRGAIYESLQTLILFPKAGRRQSIEGVRKIVTRKYRYLVYYTFDEAAGEVVILNVMHPVQKREQDDR